MSVLLLIFLILVILCKCSDLSCFPECKDCGDNDQDGGNHQ